jgi:hypothetical protein
MRAPARTRATAPAGQRGGRRGRLGPAVGGPNQGGTTVRSLVAFVALGLALVLLALLLMRLRASRRP